MRSTELQGVIRIDIYARRIVGWRASRTAHAGFVLDALEQAVHDRRPAKGAGLVHHSDRPSHGLKTNRCRATGSQYLSIKYTERLAEAGMSPRSAASGTVATTPWRRRSMATSKPRSSTAALGTALKPWNTQPSNGWTGSTTAASSSPSGTSRPQRPKQTTTPLWKLKPWPCN